MDCTDKMDIEQLKKHIKTLMGEKRYRHSLGVTELGKTLAEIHGADVRKTEIAGILHDCAKEFDSETMKKYLDRAEVDETVRKSPKLWHGPAGAVYAADMFGIDDEIYHAIYYHTIGVEEMPLITKIIYLADVVEVNRDEEFEWAKDIRELAKKDLDKAVAQVIGKTLVSLVERGYTVHINSVLCRNKIIFKGRG